VRLVIALLSLVLLGAGFAPDRRQPLDDPRLLNQLVKVCADGGVGCGILIGPDLVLTCAHAITTPQGEVRQGGWVEVAQRRITVNTVFLGRPGSQNPDSGEDWALLKLSRPMGWKYGWVECLSLSPSEMLNLPVEFVGFSSNPDESRPEFAGMQSPYRCPGRVADVAERIVFHDCAIWGGSSGAPLLYWVNAGECRVVAVNTAGVVVEGERLDHGFRSEYRKDLANLAVPARNWSELLRPGVRPEPPECRRLRVSNPTGQSQRLRLRFDSLYREDSPEVTEWLSVEAGSSRILMEESDGCVADFLEWQREGQSVWIRQPLLSGLTEMELF